MPHYDMPFDQLKIYKPERGEPIDFDVFWKMTVDESKTKQFDVIREEESTPLATLKVYDITFSGYDGQPVRGWLILPEGHSDKLPCIVEFFGYAGGRGYAIEHLVYASSGFAHFVMDIRGQGSVWRRGDTPDSYREEDNSNYPGFATRGISSPNSYYYRRLIIDAYRSVDTVLQLPEIDSNKVILSGFSQGGLLSLAVAGLRSDILGCAVDFPFLCHIKRGTQMVMTTPYLEIANYCKLYSDQVENIFHTLSYFDGMNFATRASCESIFSVGLMDDLCPPSTVFATYNHYSGPKKIKIYEYSQHDAGGTPQMLEKIKFFNDLVN